MIRKLKALATLGAGIGLVVGLMLAGLAAPALATPEGAHPITPAYASCEDSTGWYGGPDEETLAGNVKSTEAGFTFTGPSLAHHALAGTPKLVDLQTPDLEATVTAGTALPLVKFETDPYSTVNYDTATGKWWSSRIDAADPGGQSNPLDDPSEFEGLAIQDKTWDEATHYTAATVVRTIGIGYANDAGHAALVTGLGYGESAGWDFTCPEPEETESPSPNPTMSPLPDPTSTKGPTKGATPTPSFSMLPVTGSDTEGVNPLAILLPIAAVLVLGGAGLFLLARDRRKGAHRA